MRVIKRIPSMAFWAPCLVWVLWISGCAGTGEAAKATNPGAPSKVGCASEIQWEVTPEAQVTEFSCEKGLHGGEPAIIFTAGVQNVSDKPLRFRLNIFLLDMDKAAGSLIPVKGKPPVLAPGKAGRAKIPFMKTTELPKKIQIVVRTASY